MQLIPARPAAWPALVALLVSCLTAATAPAQVGDQGLPISWNADTMQLDAKMAVFTGLRVTQGKIGIEADSGRASKIDFEDSVWHVAGNVRIDTGDGYVLCDSADLAFSGNQLRTATVRGTPAIFELKRADSDQVTHAEAGQLDYDLSAGVVEFSDQVTITEGGNQISSNYLLYNIREQRINAQSAGDGGAKVKMTYTPGTSETSDDKESDEAQ